MIWTFVGLGSLYRMLPCTQGGGDSMLYSFIWGCTVRPLQSDDGKCAGWAGCSEPLLVIPWALWGISAGAIMNTEIVDDDEEETRSVSRHMMLEQKAGMVSSIMLIGKRNLILYTESQALSVILPSLETENVHPGVLVCLRVGL